jgi:limonene-1,2-epoxide hydrolase
MVIGRVHLYFWVCGVFEVHDGQITLWRDYFDMFDILKSTARGLLGAVVPALRPSMK